MTFNNLNDGLYPIDWGSWATEKADYLLALLEWNFSQDRLKAFIEGPPAEPGDINYQMAESQLFFAEFGLIAIPGIGEISAVSKLNKLLKLILSESGFVRISGENSAKITGFTRHGLNSTIFHDGVGVSEKAMLDAVNNPLNVIPQSHSLIKYVGKNAIIILNNKGEVVTTWATNSVGYRIIR